MRELPCTSDEICNKFPDAPLLKSDSSEGSKKLGKSTFFHALLIEPNLDFSDGNYFDQPYLCAWDRGCSALAPCSVLY